MQRFISCAGVLAAICLTACATSAFTAQGKTDAVITRLRAEAAKLGANGVLLQGIGDQPSGSVGTGGGTESFSGGSAVGSGIGLNIGTTRKVGGDLAIFVDSK